MRRAMWGVVGLGALALAAVAATSPASAATTTYSNCEVRSVADGDTFSCSYPKRPGMNGVITVRVRLIDTPEASRWWHSGSGTWRPAECWGKTAKNVATTTLLYQKVTVVSHGRDSQGRHLGDVFLADGRDFSQWMLAEGHAAIFKKLPYLPAEDPISWAAREAGKGMWGGCSNPPGRNGRLPLAGP